MFRYILLPLLAISASAFVLERNPCKQAGFFTLIDNTPAFYGCYPNKSGGFTLKVLTCPAEQVFSSAVGYCVPSLRVKAVADAVPADDIESPTPPPSSSSTQPDIENPTVPTHSSAATDSSTSNMEETTTTKKPDEDTTTTEKPATTEKPNEDTTTKKPEEDTTTTEKPATTEKPDEDTTTKKPEEDTTTTEKPATTEKPGEDTTTTEKPATTEKPGEDTTTTKKPAEDTTTDKPDDDTTTTEGSGEPTHTTDEPNETTTTDESSEGTETTDEPNETTEPSEPTDTPTTDDPTETTGNPGETTTEGPFKCPTSGFFPTNGACNKFVYCMSSDPDTDPIELNCPQGQEFNPEILFCDAEYKCDGGAVEAKAQLEFDCIMEGVFVDHEDQAKYFVCTWNEKTSSFQYQHKTCPEKEVFHRLTGRCGRHIQLPKTLLHLGH